MKKGKEVLRIITVLLVCMIIGASSVAAKASEIYVDGSALTNESHAEGIVHPKTRGRYFANGGGSINVTGKGTVLITGNTVALQTVDSVKVTMHLQRLEGGSWVTIASYGPTVKNNDYYVSASRSYSVAGGYYYRMSGSHTVIENGVFESATSSTDGVWVS